MAIRDEYQKNGVREFYASDGAQYRNPHEPVVRAALTEALQRWSPDLSCALDLACGSGEVTLVLREFGCADVHGIDPFTGNAYLDRTGQTAECLSFEDIATGALQDRRYSLVVCSYALHLPARSRLPGVLIQLSQVSSRLLVLTPHKRPEITPAWGWQLDDEFVLERVRVRWYSSELGPEFSNRYGTDADDRTNNPKETSG